MPDPKLIIEGVMVRKANMVRDIMKIPSNDFLKDIFTIQQFTNATEGTSSSQEIGDRFIVYILKP